MIRVGLIGYGYWGPRIARNFYGLKDCKVSVICDKSSELLQRAAAAFPDVPLLGVDILKDAMTDRLLVSEVNSLGHNWNFGPDFAAAFRLDIERQFDGLRKAASILAEQTRLRAGVLLD